MEPLQPTYKKNGYEYNLCIRSGDVAVFSQASEGKIIAYEVFEVVKQREGERFGTFYPAKEMVPNTEKWGTNAFTVHTIEQATEKVKLIQKNIAERKGNEKTTTGISENLLSTV